jgi:hypothetical protein
MLWVLAPSLVGTGSTAVAALDDSPTRLPAPVESLATACVPEELGVSTVESVDVVVVAGDARAGTAPFSALFRVAVVFVLVALPLPPGCAPAVPSSPADTSS